MFAIVKCFVATLCTLLFFLLLLRVSLLYDKTSQRLTWIHFVRVRFKLRFQTLLRTQLVRKTIYFVFHWAWGIWDFFFVGSLHFTEPFVRGILKKPSVIFNIEIIRSLKFTLLSKQKLCAMSSDGNLPELFVVIKN